MSAVDYLRVETTDLAERTRALVAANGHIRMAYAWYPRRGRIEVRYLTSCRAREPFVMWTVAPDGNTVPSLANDFPRLGWYEREISDLFGVVFTGHPEPKRLVIHDGVDVPCPPLSPDFPLSARLKVTGHGSGMPELDGPDVQRLPWGPVRADVVESAEFRFFYVGEHILHLHPQLFFKHRGVEKRFEGARPEYGTILAERVSGVGTFTHALAFCQAVESASGCEPPPRTLYLRVLLAEMERLYNHLHYLGHLAETTTLTVAAAEGKYLEERAKQLNSRLTGSRFLRSLLTPGGLRRDIDPGTWLAKELQHLKRDIDAYTSRLESTNSYLDRLITTGQLTSKIAYDQGATGPIRRASGVGQDLRRDHPYAAYGEFDLKVPVRTEGDAHARCQVRIDEIAASLKLIEQVLQVLPKGEIRASYQAPVGREGIGWSESPRGSLFYAVHFDERGLLKRVKVKSPSFSNWRVFPFTVHDSNMMDYAINEASFGLTIAGCDR
jgi:Ni,Fe-hydrogenase III large subunit/NADH:ubiquinone oxidoreductase subunit C